MVQSNQTFGNVPLRSMTNNHNFYIFRSSAGSGKTHALVRSYLQLALSQSNHNYYKHILAITFTNKAAAEMKSRVISTLKALAENRLEGTPKVMQEELLDKLGIDEKSLQNRANQVLNHMLHHYGDIAISTIDSFIYRIIQAFSIDLGLPLNFNLSVEQDELVNSSIEELIKQIGVDEKLTQSLIQFSIEQIQNEQSWQFNNQLSEIAGKLLKDSYPLEELVDKLTEEKIVKLEALLNQEIKAFEQSIEAFLEPCISYITENGLTPNDFHGKNTGVGSNLIKAGKGDFEHLLKAISKYGKLKNWYSSRATAEKKALVEAGGELFNTQLTKIEQYINQFYPKHLLHLNLKKNLFSLRVLARVKSEVDAFKASNNMVHISDFQKIIEQIVSKEPIPFVYERVGTKYRHFLLDEFQDTSAIQFRNMLPLIHNSLASGNYNMVVGDGKQSIYRWRGAEVEQFSKLPSVDLPENSILNDAALYIQQSAKEVPLQFNWRSATEIVEFNNFFFKQLQSHLSTDFQFIYNKQKQEPKRTHKGEVHLKFRLVDNKKELLDYSLNQTLQALNHSVESGFSYADISILVRKNEQGRKVVQHLLNHNIPVISAESLLVNSSPKVRLLVALIEWLNEPNEKLNQAQVVLLLKENKLLDQHLHAILKQIGLDQHFSFEEWLKNHFSDFTLELKNWPILPLFVELLRITQLDNKWDSFLESFIEQVNSWTSKENEGIAQFLEWWKEKKEKLSIGSAEEKNAVQVMTIHKSKGLEYPVAIMPFLEVQRFKSGQTWFNIDQNKYEIPTGLIDLKKNDYAPWMEEYEEEEAKSLLDDVNVLYVGFTRATHKLYAFSAFHSHSNKLSPMLLDCAKKHPNWNEESQELSIGEVTSYISKHSKSNVELMNEFRSSNWNEKIEISKVAPLYWDLSDETTATELGTTIHKILAECEQLVQWKSILEQYQSEGIVGVSDVKAIEQVFKKLEKERELDAIFQLPGKVLTEREIILRNGDLLRPDRVVISNDTNFVIDFKTGKKLNKHVTQINRYRKALERINGQSTIAYLVYLNPLDIVIIKE